MMKKNGELKTKYLIIGNSAGAIGAAEAIREIDRDSSLAIVSDEPFPAYSRPLISEYVSHERKLATMLFRPADFYEKNNIGFFTGERAAHLDTDCKTVTLAGGLCIAWDKLLLATGGNPIMPSIKGLDKRGVFSFIRLHDAQQIDDYLINVNSAVVIGGGLIGISVTEALVKRGIVTSLVEMKDRVLNTILDETASSMVEATLCQRGIRIVTGHTVAGITGNDKVEGIILDNGQQISCDMVLLAIGVTPRVDLVQGTNIRLNRGMIVDRRMQTSVPDIYACGDVAEAYDFTTGTNRVIPIWPNAYLGGRVAGYNMAGYDKEYLGGTSMNSVNYFGLNICSAGLVSAPDDKNFQTLSSQSNGVYRKIILRDGIIKGIIFIKDIEKSGLIYGLLHDSIDVSGFKDTLLKDDFGLINFPAGLRHQRLSVLKDHYHAVPVKEAEELPVTGDY